MSKRWVLLSLPILSGLMGCREKLVTPTPPPQLTLSIAVEPDSLPADGVSSAIVSAEVKKGDSPAESVEVKFHTTLGKITAKSITDSNGIATATLTSDTIAKTAEVTAYCGNRSVTTNVVFFEVSQDIYISSLTASPSTIPADGTSQSTISATFKYTSGAPAEGLIVSFSASLGTITPYDTTDTSGLASAVLTSSTTPGTSLVRVWYGSARDSISVIFSEQPTGDTIPASIVLYSIDYQSISVHGTGGNETSTIIFQVRDATGLPVSGVHTVNFSIAEGPGGGEYLYPTSATTETLALATTHLNSGTISGPVKITAQVDGTSIFSEPVMVVILSGPPHKDHFSVVTEKLNLYALWYAGVEDKITAFVADLHGNPVADNTAVWFSTQCGLIQPGSGYTVQGVTSNTLVSCAPWPMGGSFTNGFFWVYGWTIDGNDSTIVDSARVLWTHDTILELTPLSFDIPNAGSQDFTIRVYDLNGNPLTEGTTITVQASVGDLHWTDIILPDTQDTLWTIFNFSLHDDEPDTTNPRDCKVTVDVNSENGNVSKVAYGTIN